MQKKEVKKETEKQRDALEVKKLKTTLFDAAKRLETGESFKNLSRSAPTASRRMQADAEEERRSDHGEDRERDGRLPAAHRHARALGGRRGGCRDRGAHRPASFEREIDGTRQRNEASGVGSRKIARTRGGAAMNSTMNDCTTSTMSTGMPSAACIV